MYVIFNSFLRFYLITNSGKTLYLICLFMCQIISSFLNYWNDWSAEQIKTWHERDLGPRIQTHEFWVVLVSIGLPAFLRKCLPSLQWSKLLLWPCFEGLNQIAALSHPRSCWLPPAPRKSLILCLCLCSSSLGDITSRLLAQQIKDGKFHPVPAYLVSLPCKIRWNACAAFRNNFDWVHLE